MDSCIRPDDDLEICSTFWKCLFKTSPIVMATPHSMKSETTNTNTIILRLSTNTDFDSIPGLNRFTSVLKVSNFYRSHYNSNTDNPRIIFPLLVWIMRTACLPVSNPCLAPAYYPLQNAMFPH